MGNAKTIVLRITMNIKIEMEVNVDNVMNFVYNVKVQGKINAQLVYRYFNFKKYKKGLSIRDGSCTRDCPFGYFANRLAGAC